MKVAIVPASLIAKTGRLDADFYIGTQPEQRVERARGAIVAAKKRLKNAKAAVVKRNAERRKFGIKTVKVP